MNIKHVYQPDDTGCGIACIAMLTGKRYNEIKASMIEANFFDDVDSFETSFKDLKAMLTTMGCTVGPKRKFKRWRNIPAKVAIASTNYDVRGIWHWVVFVRDIDGHYIFDPGKRRKKIRDLRGKMSGYFIEIFL